jgi:hypothetical protein
MPAFEKLLAGRTAQSFRDAERGVHEVLREVADSVVALELQAIAVDPDFERSRSTKLRERPVCR